ncbi:MAG: 50S ribosomal protein L25 [Planctomycetota bacterium]
MDLNATPTLSASKRERTGSRYSQRLRSAGQLPVVLYGHGEDPESLALPAKETLEHIHKGDKLFKLDLSGKEQFVLLTDLQFDHLGTNIVHADFARVDPTERVSTTVRVELIGDAVGLKTTGAILMHPATELAIECLVTNMPESIEVDVSALEAGDSISAGDVTLPLPTMVLESDPSTVLAQIVVQAEVSTDAEAETVSGDAAQPEVITEKKAEDDA